MVPIESNLNMYRQPIKCFFIDDIELTTNLKKEEIERMIQHILSNKCGMNVIGYNQYDNDYWCKNIKNNIVNSYFKITISGYGFDINTIKILPIISNKLGIKNFEFALKNALAEASSSHLTHNE